jgi:hypothetical protein
MRGVNKTDQILESYFNYILKLVSQMDRRSKLSSSDLKKIDLENIFKEHILSIKKDI